jgi:phospholipase C
MSMQNIEHVVVLMLENRSFDSLLGWLYEKDAQDAHYLNIVPDASAKVPPANTQGAKQGDLFRGLQSVDPGKFVNTALNGTLSAKPTRGVRGFTVTSIDPGEEFEHVNTQFYGTPTPGPGSQITMTGVLSDFVEVMQKLEIADADVRRLAGMSLESFTPGQLPVLNQLAKHYAVSDDWFASVPSQTNPNRAFLMCGTSNGMVNNGDLETDPRAKALQAVFGMAIGDDRVDAPTIFNALSDAGSDWTVFWQTSYLPNKISNLLTGLPLVIPLLASIGRPVLAAAATAILAVLQPLTDYLGELTSGNLTSSYTWRLFPQIEAKVPNAAQHFQTLEDFYRRARGGQLPKFSYIEPYWSISHTSNPALQQLVTVLGNDYHPPSNTLVAEQFVKDVYTSLIANRDAWSKTLLIITFDEFVGSFDHVTDRLGGAVAPPWGPNGQPPFKSPTNFNFDRLGARVPTILVSPYVQKRTVFRSAGSVPYDHTSVIATTLKWLGQDSHVGEFGARTAAAPTFDGVLTLDEPRTDEDDLSFLDAPRKTGDLVQYGDSFVLQNQNGEYLTSFYCTMKLSGGGSLLPDSVMGILVDLGVAAFFPTLGGGGRATLSFVTQSPDPVAQIDNNAEVMLVSRESGLGAFNLLGAWQDSHDCYYSNEFLDGDNATKQKWVVQKVDNTDQALRYGDRIYLVSQFFQGQRLTRDTRWFQSGWVTTGAGGDSWTLLPAGTVFRSDRIDGTNCLVLDAGERVVSWDDGYQTCKVGSHVDGTNCLVLKAGQVVVSWESGYQTCKVGDHVDGTNCLVLDVGQSVVSWESGFQNCKVGDRIDGTNCFVLDAGARVVSWDDGYQTCRVGSHIDGTNCLVLKAGQSVVSWENGYQTPCRVGDRIDGSNCLVLDAGARVVSWESGYQNCRVGSHIDGTNCLVLEAGARVVSWDEGYKSCRVGSRLDGTNCLVLKAGQRVVSWDDGYQSCRVGSHIDGTNCLVLEAGQFIVSWEDGYQTCKVGDHVDGTNCVILEAGARVVSWDDGYQTCRVGSRIDGTNCLILDAGARVVSWEDGYQTCRVGSHVDGTNCLVLKAGQHVVSWEDGYQT